VSRAIVSAFAGCAPSKSFESSPIPSAAIPPPIRSPDTSFTADAGAALAVRLALLVHDLGKPESAWRGDDGRLHYYENRALGKRAHEEIGAELASTILSRLRYPTVLRRHVRRLVRRHMFFPPKEPDPVRARRFLAKHGDELAFDLLDHKEADLRGKGTGATDEVEQLQAFRRVVEEQRTQPHRLGDLEVDGNDLIELGYEPGPAIGETLERLLHEVVGDPTLNRKDWLLDEAKRLL